MKQLTQQQKNGAYMVYILFNKFKQKTCLFLYNVSLSGVFLILVDLRNSGCCGLSVDLSPSVDFLRSVDFFRSVDFLLSTVFLYNVIIPVKSDANKQGENESFCSFSEKS